MRPVRPLPRSSMGIAVALGALLVITGCQERSRSEVPPEKSRLKVATDVFWALDGLGYAIAKEKPPAARRGCEPSEFLAKRGEAIFRISVFHCGDPDQARALVDHPKSRHVDGLLRNHGDGGILQRGPMEIVIRKTHGDRQAAEKLLEELGAM